MLLGNVQVKTVASLYCTDIWQWSGSRRDVLPPGLVTNYLAPRRSNTRRTDLWPRLWGPWCRRRMTSITTQSSLARINTRPAVGSHLVWLSQHFIPSRKNNYVILSLPSTKLYSDLILKLNFTQNPDLIFSGRKLLCFVYCSSTPDNYKRTRNETL